MGGRGPPKDSQSIEFQAVKAAVIKSERRAFGWRDEPSQFQVACAHRHLGRVLPCPSATSQPSTVPKHIYMLRHQVSSWLSKEAHLPVLLKFNAPMKRNSGGSRTTTYLFTHSLSRTPTLPRPSDRPPDMDNKQYGMSRDFAAVRSRKSDLDSLEESPQSVPRPIPIY